MLKIVLKTTLEKKNKDILLLFPLFSDTLAEFAGKSYDVRNVLNAVERLFKFLVVGLLPASSATAERSFSTLRRLKNYLRLTRPITQERLNHVAVHHVHKTIVDALDIKKIKQQCLYTPMNIGVGLYNSVFGQFVI